MLIYLMSLPYWLHVTLAVVGYLFVSYIGIIYAIAHNRTTQDLRYDIGNGWQFFWAVAWPLVSLYYPIHKMIQKGFLQKWLYEAPVLYITNYIEQSKIKKIEKNKIPEKDFHVKNDWRD